MKDPAVNVRSAEPPAVAVARPIDPPKGDSTRLSSPSGALSKALGAGYRRAKRDYLGLGLSCMSDEDIVDAVAEAIRSRSRLVVSFINPDYVRRAHRTLGLVDKINDFDIVLPDGWGVVYGARLLGLPIANRQSNDDICPKIFALSARDGFSNFLFGCDEGIPEQAAENLVATYPALRIAGTRHARRDGPSGHPESDEDLEMLVATINAARPDILHVSMPTPRQQNWVALAADRLDVPVIITGGGYLDHLAERIQWYPWWVNRMRLGWLYRLCREPRRLWKRYSVDLVAYGWMVLRQWRAQGWRPQR